MLVAFSDACAFQARTTKKTLELALIFFALPFLIILDLGLRRNLLPGWKVKWSPQIPITDSSSDGCRFWCDGGESDVAVLGDDDYSGPNITMDARERLESKIINQVTNQSTLSTAPGLLETNMILLFKSVVNYAIDPKATMIMSLKVQRTELRNAELMISDLSSEEQDAAFEFIKTDPKFREKESGDSQIRGMVRSRARGQRDSGSRTDFARPFSNVQPDR